ncbi:MAG: response regulator [Treponema sp.]|jgi:signal transduction histidine kinase/CheY-like chemotaxis protein|nr:response regulator [Treponema sp.]
MSIRVRSILAIVLTSVVIIIIGIGAGLEFIQRSLLITVKKDLFAVADIADRLISSEISLLKANTSTASRYIVEASRENLKKALNEQVEIYPGILALTVLEAIPGGWTANSAGKPPVHPSFFNSQYIQSALAGESVISTSRIDPSSGQLVFHVCVPMGGNRVLAATVDGLYFSQVLEGLTIWQTGHIFVDDPDGYVLANPRREWVEGRYNFIVMAKTEPQYQSIASVVNRMIQKETGIGIFSVDGIDRFCAYRPITGSKSGWSLGVIAPVNESPLQSSRAGFMLVGLICLGLCVIAAIGVSAFLEKPYKTISGMMVQMEHQEVLLHTINQTAEILLRTNSARFEEDLHNCMGMMAQSINVDRMRIFQNVAGETGTSATLIHEWIRDAPPGLGLSRIHFSYDREAPSWYAKLSARQCVNSPAADFSSEERKLLYSHDILAILIVPLFIQGQFWGFVSFDDCQKGRVFSIDEEGIMGSGALLMVNALERNEMEKDMIRAHEEAVTGTEAKSRFLANMSHEMRTPLNAVIGLAELTLSSGQLKNEDHDNLTKIYNSGVTLLGLINDILDLSKIESGKFEIIPVEYDTPSLLNDTVTLNSVRIGSKPISFQLHIDETLPSVLRGDDLRIKQMFNNLLSNAFKYTKEGRVDWTVSCRREGNSVWLTSIIKDTGIGIRKEDMWKLFSDYNQVDTKSNREIEGTGLGLAITQKMAKMMDGDITVESEYGKGTVFTLRIRQDFVNDIPIGREVAEKLQNFQYSDHKRDRSAKLLRVRLPYARVLVVDDVTINLDVAKGLLKPYGMRVDCVTSGIEAITQIREEKVRYSAIFMDHMMPEMDGIEAVRIIREEIGTDYARNIPIIALTANAILGNEEMFLSKGFQAFLSKPIDIIALDAAINRWIRDKALEKELAAQGINLEETGESGDGGGAKIGGDFLAGWDIAEVNAVKGLERFGGDLESYRDVLVSYARNTPSMLDKIRDFTGEKLNDYRVIVHGIKSSSRGIGAEALGSKAEALEFAARDGGIEFIGKENKGFIEEMDKLVAALSSFLERKEQENPKPAKTAPDPALLAALAEACKAFDVDEVDRIMEQLEGFRYESSADLVSWLREQINITGFDQIVERLSAGVVQGGKGDVSPGRPQDFRPHEDPLQR